MEKKLKVSEFAELIGITAKTAYKMIERNEIITVTERVNNRSTTLIVTNDEQIKHFREVYSKYIVNNGNYEDIVTNNNDTMNCNNASQSANNNEIIQDMFERIIILNDEYNNRIEKLNSELIDSKSKLLLLEDKAGREGLYFKEINELKKENEQLKTDKTKVANQLTCVIVALLMVVVGLITYNITINTKKEQPLQEFTQPVNEIHPPSNKPVKAARRN